MRGIEETLRSKIQKVSSIETARHKVKEFTIRHKKPVIVLRRRNGKLFVIN